MRDLTLDTCCEIVSTCFSDMKYSVFQYLTFFQCTTWLIQIRKSVILQNRVLLAMYYICNDYKDVELKINVFT